MLFFYLFTIPEKKILIIKKNHVYSDESGLVNLLKFKTLSDELAVSRLFM